MNDYLYLDAGFVKAQIAKLIDANPELGEDDELRFNMIEGETNAYRVIQRALEQRQEAEMLAGAIGARIVEMSARQGRYARKSEAMKALIKSIMKVANLPRLTLPDASLSILAPRQSVGIEDLDAIPQGYFRIKKEADKAAIKQALESGQEVPGAILVLGSEGLRIQSK
jgi:hypothetical protein